MTGVPSSTTSPASSDGTPIRIGGRRSSSGPIDAAPNVPGSIPYAEPLVCGDNDLLARGVLRRAQVPPRVLYDSTSALFRRERPINE